MAHVVKALAAEQPTSKNRWSQNGVKFRSICGTCNNERLGLEFDPELIAFCNSADSILSSNLLLPRLIRLACKPQRLMRAIVGHILAFGIDRVPSGPFETALAKYFLDYQSPLPREIEVFYWLYPYNDQVIIRDALWWDIKFPVPNGVLFKLLKFYPVSFFITWQRPDAYGFQFQRLSDHRAVGLDEQRELLVETCDLPPRRWPEAPTDPKFVTIYGQDAMVAWDQKGAV